MEAGDDADRYDACYERVFDRSGTLVVRPELLDEIFHA
jgi:hypothetical protein